MAGGIPGGAVGGVVGGIPAPPPPPPPAPVRVGGQIKEPKKIKDVRPVYPPIAQSARVSGIVIIEATIGVDGTVTDARVIRPVALLDQALSKEALHNGRERGTGQEGRTHDRPSASAPTKRSKRAPTSASRCGAGWTTGP